MNYFRIKKGYRILLAVFFKIPNGIYRLLKTMRARPRMFSMESYSEDTRLQGRPRTTQRPHFSFERTYRSRQTYPRFKPLDFG
jgi:hypothetical protein